MTYHIYSKAGTDFGTFEAESKAAALLQDGGLPDGVLIRECIADLPAVTI